MADETEPKPEARVLISDIFVVPTDQPHFEGPEGIKYDFNYGCRICIPKRDQPIYIKLTDADTDQVFFDGVVDTSTESKTLTADQKWFHRWHFEIRHIDNTPLFDYVYDAKNQPVLIQCPRKCGMGDAIAWFTSAVEFQTKWECELYVFMPAYVASIFKSTYTWIHFVTEPEIKSLKRYATYYVGLFFGNEPAFQPEDFRITGIHGSVASILGVKWTGKPPRIEPTNKPPIEGKYVCIAANASAHYKHWNYPGGWMEIIDYLKSFGYRVLCIDRDKVLYRGEGILETIPYGSEDFTGNKPLQERINLLCGADFFIGVGSGLAWLAWCCNIPTVMISGFSHPTSEFFTKYRVINYGVCNSCWNDLNCHINHKDPMWCPRHRKDEKVYECSRAISPKMVKTTIDRVMHELVVMNKLK